MISLDRAVVLWDEDKKPPIKIRDVSVPETDREKRYICSSGACLLGFTKLSFVEKQVFMLVLCLTIMTEDNIPGEDVFDALRGIESMSEIIDSFSRISSCTD